MKKTILFLFMFVFTCTCLLQSNVYARDYSDVEIITDTSEKIGYNDKKTEYLAGKASSEDEATKSKTTSTKKKQEKNEQMDILNIRDSIKVELQKNNNNFPKLRTNYCLSSSLFSFCVDNKGNLYKCWDDIGIKDRSYGNIESWNINNPFKTADNLNILTKYLNSPGILNEECYNCVWLPICAGGCSSKKFFQNIKCVPYKYDTDFLFKKLKKF